jgi:hypothetical protein
MTGHVAPEYPIREEDKSSKDKDARRSSPLLLHIHPVFDCGFVAVHTLLPARFLPAGKTIRIKAGRNTSQVSPSINWDVLGNYLNRFITNGGEVIHGKQ